MASQSATARILRDNPFGQHIGQVEDDIDKSSDDSPPNSKRQKLDVDVTSDKDEHDGGDDADAPRSVLIARLRKLLAKKHAHTAMWRCSQAPLGHHSFIATAPLSLIRTALEVSDAYSLEGASEKQPVKTHVIINPIAGGEYISFTTFDLHQVNRFGFNVLIHAAMHLDTPRIVGICALAKGRTLLFRDADDGAEDERPDSDIDGPCFYQVPVEGWRLVNVCTSSGMSPLVCGIHFVETTTSTLGKVDWAKRVVQMVHTLLDAGADVSLKTQQWQGNSRQGNVPAGVGVLWALAFAVAHLAAPNFWTHGWRNQDKALGKDASIVARIKSLTDTADDDSHLAIQVLVELATSLMQLYSGPLPGKNGSAATSVTEDTNKFKYSPVVDVYDKVFVYQVKK